MLVTYQPIEDTHMRHYVFSRYTYIGNQAGYGSFDEARTAARLIASKYSDVYIVKTEPDGEMKHVITIKRGHTNELL